MYLAQLATFAYWFDFPRPISTFTLVLFIAVFATLFVGGLLALMFYPKIEDRWKRQVVRRSGSGSAWIGVLGLMFVFARVEYIPLFMYRFWFLILGIAFVVWAIRLNRYARERKEKLIEETRLYQTKQKYLKH
jgi:peptidoglycan/LPS O-acetylase OafA/YrhL